MMQHLDRQIHSAMELGARLKRIDETITLTPQYIQRTSMHERHGRWGAGGMAGEMEEMMELEKPGGFMK